MDKLNYQKIIDLTNPAININEMSNLEKYKLGYFDSCKSGLSYKYDTSNIISIKNLSEVAKIFNSVNRSTWSFNSYLMKYKYFYPLTKAEFQEAISKNFKYDKTLTREEIINKYRG